MNTKTNQLNQHLASGIEGLMPRNGDTRNARLIATGGILGATAGIGFRSTLIE